MDGATATHERRRRRALVRFGLHVTFDDGTMARCRSQTDVLLQGASGSPRRLSGVPGRPGRSAWRAGGGERAMVSGRRASGESGSVQHGSVSGS